MKLIAGEAGGFKARSAGQPYAELMAPRGDASSAELRLEVVLVALVRRQTSIEEQLGQADLALEDFPGWDRAVGVVPDQQRVK